jgi:hypothetical protein
MFYKTWLVITFNYAGNVRIGETKLHHALTCSLQVGPRLAKERRIYTIAIAKSFCLKCQNQLAEGNTRWA